jgi:hypothetical protein
MLWRFFWQCVWDMSEWSGYGLGRFAPFVFNQTMEQYRPTEVKNDGS